MTLTDKQRARVRELTDTLRADHSRVIVNGARITVPRSKIAATVEPDGGAWLTWADGNRTYSGPHGAPVNIIHATREG